MTAIPIQIHFRNMDSSQALEDTIRDHAQKLESFADNIVSLRITVIAPHKHQKKGRIYHAVIDVRVPGEEIVVSHQSDQRDAHEDVYIAVRDAFAAARRQLQDHARIQRGKVKLHETSPHGRITSLHPEDNYGRIETPDGRDIYFHRNSVTNEDFDRLEAGLEVRFAEELGTEGPQATSVQVIGKHHIVG
jgi:cold shock CspA family protein/ribosome-associated translation inhibitor RaiA